MGQGSLFATLLTAATVSIIAGCTDEEQRRKGTLSGFKLCLERASKQGLLPSAQRTHCLGKHEIKIPAKIDGKAGYHTNFNNKAIYFEGNVQNTSTNYIITRYSFTLKRKDRDVTQTKEVKAHIEPGDKSGFSTLDLAYTPEWSEIGNDKFEWWTHDIRGLEISTH